MSAVLRALCDRSVRSAEFVEQPTGGGADPLLDLRLHKNPTLEEWQALVDRCAELARELKQAEQIAADLELRADQYEATNY